MESLLGQQNDQGSLERSMASIVIKNRCDVRLALGVASELVSTGGENMRENDNSVSKCIKYDMSWSFSDYM